MPEYELLDDTDLKILFDKRMTLIDEFARSGRPAVYLSDFEDDREQAEWWRSFTNADPRFFCYRPDRDELDFYVFNLEVLASDRDRYRPLIAMLAPLIERNLNKTIDDFDPNAKANDIEA